MEVDARRSSAVPSQRYVVGVASESVDVILDPLQCHNLIFQAGITWTFVGARVQEPYSIVLLLESNTQNIISLSKTHAYRTCPTYN